MTFASLGLEKPILGGVAAAGYSTPTEIQQRSIPIVLSGHDLIACGQTGTGKTAAYGLPILNSLLGGPRGLRAVILVPTRELCVQVAENLRLYAQHAGLSVCTAFGGVDMSIQISAFKRGLDVLVACPGRLIDHLERGNLNLQHLEVIVLDEADRMLDMGFIPQIRRIFVRCPRERQNLLFSATMPPEIEDLVRDFIPKAERVQVGARSQVAQTITHRFERCNAHDKVQALERILANERGRVLVFVRTKVRAEQLGNQLRRARLPADSIHGDKGAEARHSVLQAFDRGKMRFLVATDVAARGIDVMGIDLVVNYDVPHAAEDYVHRVGRTGRAGQSGRALTLVAPAERGYHDAIVHHLERHERGSAHIEDSVDEGAPHGAQPHQARHPAASSHGHGRSQGHASRSPVHERRSAHGSQPVSSSSSGSSAHSSSAGSRRPRRRGGRAAPGSPRTAAV